MAMTGGALEAMIYLIMMLSGSLNTSFLPGGATEWDQTKLLKRRILGYLDKSRITIAACKLLVGDI